MVSFTVLFTDHVRGKVISPEDSSDMPGVYVVLKGTDIGSITCSDGSFNISIRKKKDINPNIKNISKGKFCKEKYLKKPSNL